VLFALLLLVGATVAFFYLCARIILTAVKTSSELLRACDLRVDLVGEAVKHVRGLRILRWDRFFTEKRVLRARRLETDLFFARGFQELLLHVLLRIFPEIIFLVALFYVLSTGNTNGSSGPTLTVASLVLLRGSIQRLVSILGFLASRIRVGLVFQLLHARMMSFWVYTQRAVPQVPATSFGERNFGMRFAWQQNQTMDHQHNLLLRDGLLLQFGDVCAVHGPPGSGKSMLLFALMRELYVACPASSEDCVVLYAPQQPYLLDGTVTENVVFGLPVNDETVDLVLQICELKEEILDLETELRGNAGNLSGGQRQRLQLARCLY
ncbi:unnamed protein product, partial [Amoebophrya sp. A120]